MRDDQVKALVGQAMDAAETAHRRAEVLHDTLRKELTQLEDAILSMNSRIHKRIDSLHDEIFCDVKEPGDPLEDVTEQEIDELFEDFGKGLNPVRNIGLVMEEERQKADATLKPALFDGDERFVNIQRLLVLGFTTEQIKDMVCAGTLMF